MLNEEMRSDHSLSQTYLGHEMFRSKMNASGGMTEIANVVMQRIIGMIVNGVSRGDFRFEVKVCKFIVNVTKGRAIDFPIRFTRFGGFAFGV
jgi:hypothetical protein